MLNLAVLSIAVVRKHRLRYYRRGILQFGCKYNQPLAEFCQIEIQYTRFFIPGFPSGKPRESRSGKREIYQNWGNGKGSAWGEDREPSSLEAIPSTTLLLSRWCRWMSMTTTKPFAIHSMALSCCRFRVSCQGLEAAGGISHESNSVGVS